jgi:hypothetical protein
MAFMSEEQLEDKIHGLERLKEWLGGRNDRHENLCELIGELRAELKRRSGPAPAAPEALPHI